MRLQGDSHPTQADANPSQDHTVSSRWIPRTYNTPSTNAFIPLAYSEVLELFIDLLARYLRHKFHAQDNAQEPQAAWLVLALR